MLEIKIHAKSTEEVVNQMQSYLGGEITEKWGEYVLNFNNEIGKGHIKCLTLDWGVSLMEINALFLTDLFFINDNTLFNPIHFTYVSEGQLQHRFSDEEDFQVLQQYHTAILVPAKHLAHIAIIPKNISIKINIISVIRREYLLKRNVNVELLNDKMHQIFIDERNESTFAFYGPIHLKMEDRVEAIRNSSHNGMTRILHIEGEVYQLLSMHIASHDHSHHSDVMTCKLSNSELKIIRDLGETIINNPAKNYSLEYLSHTSNLSQAKLQEGFKFLYTRTVTEYIRFIRLEAARDLIITTELNISQIVYSIGFTSRSYFSKIFKETYGMTPNEFKKQIINKIDVAI